MVTRARRLLEADQDVWKDHVAQRLHEVHGSQASLDWLHQQRTVTRTELLAKAKDIVRSPGRKSQTRKTSGSTGTPFVFPKDRTMTAWMDAAMWAVYSWHGIEPGQPHVRFWGTPTQTRQRLLVRSRDWLLHRYRVGAFDLAPRNVVDQFRKIERLEPAYAYGYPTLMRTFAEYCQDHGLQGRDLGLNVAVVTGEILTPGTAEYLAEFFGCPIVNEYGCTESGILGFQCEYGTMHMVPVAAWPEIVDGSGEPVPPGEEGEVVVTDLFGRVMPLLRYRLHDRARWGQDSCACGRDLPELKIVSGRSDSFIETPSGKVYDAILAYTVPKSVQRFKVRQTRPDRLEAEIVPGVGFEPGSTPAECARRWQEALGSGMTIGVEVVEDIPPEPSGKLRYFVPMPDQDKAS